MSLLRNCRWLSLVLSDTGFFGLVAMGVLSLGLGWVAGEGKDWLAWFAASLFTLFFLLRTIADSPPLGTFTGRFLVLIWGIGLADVTLLRWWKSSTLGDFFISIALLFSCAVLVVRALGPYTKASPPVFKVLPALTAATLLYAVTRLSFWRSGFLGPFSQVSEAVLPAVLLVACALLPRVLSSEPDPAFAKPWRATVLSVLAFGLLSLLTPITPDTAAHHWSFYLGPVGLVRAGGHLLHSVPSQYGFGSILLLTLLPFDSVTSLYFCVWGSTLAFAALIVWKTLKCFSPGVGLKASAMVGVFSAVYILPGWVPGAVGTFSCPSVTGFRFFWSALLAVWVPSLYSHPSRLGEKLLFAVAVGCASLWAFESFLYCAAVLGFSLVGAAAYSLKSGSFLPLKWFGQRIVVPAVGGLTCTLALTYLLYQWLWGLWPDAYAFVEFPRAYSKGFGALGIAWHSSAVFLSFVVWAIGVCCVLSLEPIHKKSEAPSLNPFSAMGYALGVLTYFISRSHDNNAVNLVPSMILALSMAVSSLPREPLSKLACQTKPVVRALWFLTVAFSLALGVRYLPLQTKSPLPGLDRTLIESQVPPLERGILEAIRSRMQRGERFSVAPDGPDLFSSPFLPYSEGLPIAPPAEYYILSQERQVEYLDRWSKLRVNRPAHVLSVLWPNPDCRWPRLKNPFSSYLQTRGSAVGSCETYGGWSLQSYEIRGDS